MVEQYRQTVLGQPKFRQNVAVQAGPEAFGAAIGRGLGSVGQGLSVVADANRYIKERDADALAKDYEIRQAEQDNATLYDPKTGYMHSQGRTAVDGVEGTNAKLKANAEQLASELDKINPDAGRIFRERGRARSVANQSQVLQHGGTERHQVIADSSKASAELSQNDAMLGYKDPAKITQSINAGIAQLHQYGTDMGFTPEQQQIADDKYRSETHLAIATQHAIDDPLAGEAYLKEHRSEMTPADAANFDAKISTAVTTRKGLLEAQKIRANEAQRNASSAGNGSDYSTNLIARESSGNTNAEAKGSTAVGLGQFVEGTWKEFIDEVHPGTFEQIGMRATLDLRRDPAYMKEAITWYAQKNAPQLQAAGLDPNDTNLYMAHFLGPQGAITALTADPNALFKDVLPESARSNPSFANKTVAEVIAGARGRFGTGHTGTGGSPVAPAGGTGQSSYASVQEQLDAIEDPAVREVARKQIAAEMATKAKFDAEQKKAISNDAFEVVAGGFDPTQLPFDVQASLGAAGMVQLMNYRDRIAKAEDTTDENKWIEYSDIIRKDPVAFAKMDINPWREFTSKEDFRAFREQQDAILKDTTKARENTATVSASIDYLKETALASGIDFKKDPKTEAMMQRQMMQWHAQFVQENQRQPSMTEAQQIADAYVLPVIVGTPGVAGWFSTGMAMSESMSGLAALSQQGQNDVLLPAVAYTDIPRDLRIAIEQNLVALGDPNPSQEEVALAYTQMIRGDAGLDPVEMNPDVSYEPKALYGSDALQSIGK